MRGNLHHAFAAVLADVSANAAEPRKDVDSPAIGAGVRREVERQIHLHESVLQLGCRNALYDRTACVADDYRRVSLDEAVQTTTAIAATELAVRNDGLSLPGYRLLLGTL